VGFLSEAYETLQFKANETAASLHKINAVRIVQVGFDSQKELPHPPIDPPK